MEGANNRCLEESCEREYDNLDDEQYQTDEADVVQQQIGHMVLQTLATAEFVQRQLLLN